jgi:hypothetical protein
MHFLFLILTLGAHADQGMWLPEQIPEVAKGYNDLKIDPEVLADPMGPVLGSVVSLGGCSGSFVSDTGLIITNHHCVETYLQSISTDDENRWRNGFAAASLQEEASTGSAGRVWITLSQEDKTTEVLQGISKRTKDTQRATVLESNKKQLITACEAQGPDRRCRVASFDGGARFLLIQTRQLDDLRVVWAPPRSVGQFGGEIDNWEWPRHGFDIALLRVYTAPDGSSATYAEDNVPFRPKHHLEMSPGLQNGGLAFVAGYPGRTERNRLAQELAFDIEENWSRTVTYVDRVMPILEKHAASSKSASARIGPSISGLSNVRKNRVGVLEGIERSHGLAKMKHSQEELSTWIRADKKRKRAYEPIFNELQAVLKEQRQAAHQDRLVGNIRWASDLLSIAQTALRWVQQQKRPDAERELGFQERDRPNLERRFKQLDRSFYLPAERDLLVDAVKEYLSGKPDQRWPAIDTWLKDMESPEKLVEKTLTEAPPLATIEARLALLTSTEEKLQESTDPLIQLAIAIEREQHPKREAGKTRRARLQRLRAAWSNVESAYAKHRGVLRASDANGTLRVTLGHVQGYEPQDGLWAHPFTTLSGFASKAGEAPFDAPQNIVKAALDGSKSPWAVPHQPSPLRAPSNDVPIDFLADLDTTGGNSGSPCFDAHGRLAGLLFDGVWESVANDYVYDDATNRSIVADIRALGWLLSLSPQTEWIRSEMGLTR